MEKIEKRKNSIVLFLLAIVLISFMLFLTFYVRPNYPNQDNSTNNEIENETEELYTVEQLKNLILEDEYYKNISLMMETSLETVDNKILLMVKYEDLYDYSYEFILENNILSTSYTAKDKDEQAGHIYYSVLVMDVVAQLIGMEEGDFSTIANAHPEKLSSLKYELTTEENIFTSFISLDLSKEADLSFLEEEYIKVEQIEDKNEYSSFTAIRGGHVYLSKESSMLDVHHFTISQKDEYSEEMYKSLLSLVEYYTPEKLENFKQAYPTISSDFTFENYTIRTQALDSDMHAQEVIELNENYKYIIVEVDLN